MRIRWPSTSSGIAGGQEQLDSFLVRNPALAPVSGVQPARGRASEPVFTEARFLVGVGMMRIDDERLDQFLPLVSKPARYTGREWNSIIKDWDGVETRIALVFPDIYDVGMSNLGLMILYHILNARDDLLAERVYAPWVDMEEFMRRNRIPPYSLESKRSLADFDIVGFSLPYEQLYSNVLNILDLAGIPLLAVERDERYPLIIAGGGASYNPEPMADFIDLFVIGEGEEVLLELVEAYQEVKSLSRQEQLRRLAQVSGLYLPRFYQPCYDEDDILRETRPLIPEARLPVVRRIVPRLPPPITRFIVPFVDVVHNRAAVEIQRGCTRGCRFCQAGMVYRPVRERPVEEIVSAVGAIVAETGFEEVALLSLSSSDYSQIGGVVQELVADGSDHLTLSLPSLRLDSFSVELMDMLQRGRRSGFTFAPEAASERLRNVINKPILDEELLQVAGEVYSRGWRNIKLYFMIGLPTETEEDVEAIVDLAKRVHAIGQRYHGKRAQVRVGVSTFVPKPHTPFQWAALDRLDSLGRKIELLKRGLRGRGLILNWNDPQESLLEAALSRGDRRLGQIIYGAWRRGAKFDAWSDQFKAKAWWDAFSQAGLDPHSYASRPRSFDEVLPWDHIDVGVRKGWLLRDYERSLRGDTLLDCREHCSACGILTTFRDLRAEITPGIWKCPQPTPQRKSDELAGEI